MGSAPPPVASGYEALFVAYMQRQLTWWLAEARTAVQLPAEQRTQVLHLLSYALHTPVAASLGCELVVAVAPFMEQAGARNEWKPFLQNAIALCIACEDSHLEARLRFHLGVLHQRTSEFQAARHEFERALTYFEQTTVLKWQVRLQNRLAYVARHLRQLNEAYKWVELAMEPELNDPEEQGYSCMVMGTLAYEQRDWEHARTWLERSLAYWKATGQQRLIAWGLTNLGIPLWGLKRYAEATRCYTQAIQLFASISDPVHLATAELNLGNVYLEQSEYGLALQVYYRAKHVFEQIRDALRLASLYNNMGMAHRSMYQWDDAERAFRLSISYWRSLNHIRSLVNAMDGLGLTLLGQGAYRQAHETFQEALAALAGIPHDPRYGSLREPIELHLGEAQSHMR